VATLRRKNDKYFVDYRINGKRFRKSVGPSKRIAELALKDIEVKIAKGESGLSPKENSLEKLFEEFLKYSKINHSPNTFDRYRVIFDNYRSFFATRPHINKISQLDLESFEDYKHFRKSKNTEDKHVEKTVEKLKFLSLVLKIAFMIGLWLCLFFAQNFTNKSLKQLSQMAKNDIIRRRVKSFANTKAIDEYKRIRQAWKEAFGLDVWYPYFAAKEIEDSVKKKLGVKIYKFKGEPQIEKNMVSYKFKTTF
jgi:hypothetical protein